MLDKLDSDFKEELKQKMREAREQQEKQKNYKKIDAKEERVVVSLPVSHKKKRIGMIAASIAVCMAGGLAIGVMAGQGNTVAKNERVYSIEGITLQTSKNTIADVFESEPSEEKQQSYLTTAETQDEKELEIYTYSDGITVRSFQEIDTEILTALEIGSTNNKQKIVYKTEAGIHLGSTKEEVYKAYGISDQTVVKKNDESGIQILGLLDGVKENEQVEEEFDEINYTNADSKDQRYCFFFKENKVTWIRLISTTESMKLQEESKEEMLQMLSEKVDLVTEGCLTAITNQDVAGLIEVTSNTMTKEERKEYLEQKKEFLGAEIRMISSSGLEQVSIEETGGIYTENISCEVQYPNKSKKEYFSVEIQVYASSNQEEITLISLPEFSLEKE